MSDSNRDNRASGYRIMDKQWEEVQKKTFTKWCNSHLVKKFGGAGAITNLEADFVDGIKLMELVNCLYNTPFPQKYNKAPKMRPQQLDNIQLSLAMLDQAGVKTNFLKPFHLADKDKTMLLGMVWSIILDYQIKGISSEEGLQGKEGLLLWCKKKTAGYKDVNVQNFHDSWQDGLGFCALIHKHRPDLLDFSKLSKNNPRENLELAFDVAEKQLGIPRLLDVDDIAETVRPDERSIVTYVSEYFHYFTSQNQSDVYGRRLGKFLELANAHDQVKNDYLKKAKQLRDWIDSKSKDLADRNYDNTLKGIESKFDEFKDYKKRDKPLKTNEKLDVESTFNSLQAMLRLNNRPDFVPPEDLSLAALDRKWNGLGDEENKRADWIRRELERQRQLEVLASRFWRKAKAMLTWGADNSSLLRANDNVNSIAQVEAKLKNHEAWVASYTYNEKRLNATKDLGQDLINQGYGRKNDVLAKISELDNMWISLRQLSDERNNALLQELERQRRLEEMRLEFANRARQLITWLEDAEDGEVAEPINSTSMEGVSKLESSFGSFLQDQSRQESEYNNLLAFAESMNAEGIHDNPYTSFSVEQISERWNRLQTEVSERRQGLDTEKARLVENDELNKQFADHAKRFLEFIESQKDKINRSAVGSLEEQLSALEATDQEVVGHKSALDELSQVSNHIEERNITHNPYTDQTIETVTLAYNNLVDQIDKQRRVIEKEIINQSGSKVPPEQLAEFKDTFRTFDKDGSGTLEKAEFDSCLQALGQLTTPEELDRIFASVSKAVPGKITFDEFVEYMISRTADSDTPDSIKEAFKKLAGDKAYITEDELRKVPISDDAREFLRRSMPKSGNGYDYNSFVEKNYRS